MIDLCDHSSSLKFCHRLERVGHTGEQDERTVENRIALAREGFLCDGFICSADEHLAGSVGEPAPRTE